MGPQLELGARPEFICAARLEGSHLAVHLRAPHPEPEPDGPPSRSSRWTPTSGECRLGLIEPVQEKPRRRDC